jgi:hypothetical protein
MLRFLSDYIAMIAGLRARHGGQLTRGDLLNFAYSHRRPTEPATPTERAEVR